MTRAFGERTAVEDVSLSLEPGELAFLIGPSGAGKTTLLRLINRELPPTHGEVWVDGIPAHRIKRGQVPALRRRVGVVFQDFKLLPRLTVLENIVFALQVTDLKIADRQARDRALDALEAVGLGDRGVAYPLELSGGQQQRVSIARAIARQPGLIIADEPTGNLDLATGVDIVDLFADIARFGAAVLVATHNMEIVRRRQQRTLTLVNGRLVRDEPAGRVGKLGWAQSS